jgi:hypothetical protein
MADVTADLMVGSPGAGRHSGRTFVHVNTNAIWKGVDAQTVHELDFLQSLSGLGKVEQPNAPQTRPRQQPGRHASKGQDIRSGSSLEDDDDDDNTCTNIIMHVHAGDVELTDSPMYSPHGSRCCKDDVTGPPVASPGTSSPPAMRRWLQDSIDSSRPSSSGTSPRFLWRVSDAFKSSHRDLVAQQSPIIRARKFSEMLHGFDLDSQSVSFKRAASRALSHRTALSGRANMGEVVPCTSDAMDMLLAVETAIYNMMKDSKRESSKAVTCKLNDEDYKASQKVTCCHHCPLRAFNL